MATTTVSTPTFADTGTLFNDATRFLEGGLWQNVVAEGGQGLGSAHRVVSDLTTVQANLTAEIASGQFTGTALTKAQGIVTSLGQEIAAANATVNGGGSFGSVAAAETALRSLHLGILDTVAGDPALAAAASQAGVTGFQAVPAAFAAGVTVQNAPHANLAEIGVIFNDAANLMIGGINSSNVAAIKADLNAARVDLQQLIAAHPDQFGGLTGIHADTIVRQLALENKFIAQVGTNPDAGRASNDNILDIIDIVQGDTNLLNMANQGGVSGFTPLPDKIGATPKYQDNADQTNFWANFIAQSNSLGQVAEKAVASGDHAAIKAAIHDIKAFETASANFDQAQGGIFEARFDNELAKGNSTLGAEVAAIVKGLQTGNAALVTAAAEQMHANAADVGGNNVSVTGVAYNTNGLTAAEVLGTAAPAVAAATGTGATSVASVTGATSVASATGATSVASATGGTSVASATGTTAGATDTAHTTGATSVASATGGTSVASATGTTAGATDTAHTTGATPVASATGAADTHAATHAATGGIAPAAPPAAATSRAPAVADNAADPIENHHDAAFQQHHPMDHFGHMWG